MNVLPTYEQVQTQLKVSQIIKEKIYENGGEITVYSIQGKPYHIYSENDGISFSCKQLPVKPPYQYVVFDIIIDLLLKQKGKAYKGNGRNYRLGSGKCTEDTVVGVIGKYYWGKKAGDSVFDPVFVLAAILQWAGIVHNRRGYIELTAEFYDKLKK